MKSSVAGLLSVLLLGLALCTSGCVTEVYSEPQSPPVYSRTTMPAASRVALVMEFRGGEPTPEARADVRAILADYLASRGSVLVRDPADADYIVYAVLERRNPANPDEWTVVSTSSARSLSAVGDEYEWPGGIIEVEDDDFATYSYIGFGVFYPIWFDLWDSPWHRGRMILCPPPHRPHRPEVRWREDRRWHRPQRWEHKESKKPEQPRYERDRNPKQPEQPMRPTPDARREQPKSDQRREPQAERRDDHKPAPTVQNPSPRPAEPKKPTTAKPVVNQPAPVAPAPAKPVPAPQKRPQGIGNEPHRPQPAEPSPAPQPAPKPVKPAPTPAPTVSPRPTPTVTPTQTPPPQVENRSTRTAPPENLRTAEAMKRAEREKAAAKANEKKGKPATTTKPAPKSKDTPDDSDSDKDKDSGRR